MIQRWRFWVCVVLLFTVALSVLGCSSGAYRELGGDLERMRHNIVQSEEISQQLIEICNTQISDIGAYWEEYDSAVQSGAELPEADVEAGQEEAQKIYDELLRQIDELNALEQGNAFNGQTGVKGFDDTVAAYQMYLGDLRRSADDIKVVFEYLFDIRDAMLPITEFEYVENTSGYMDYALMAGQLSMSVSQAQKQLAAVDCPDFLRSRHEMVVRRIDEFQAYSQDLSIAVQLSDPLRLASCDYRANRISLLLSEDERGLDDDIVLQFSHAVKRLEERAARTHDELIANIDAIVSALG